MAVPKALHGQVPFLDRKLWFPTKLGPTKNLRPSKFHFADTQWSNFFFVKILIFSAMRNLFCPRAATNGFNAHKIIKYYQDVFKKIVRKISPIVDGVGISKRSKSHDSRSFQMKTWYQNVRKLLNYKLSIVGAFRSISLDCDGYFSEKNIEISATQWSKFFLKFFFFQIPRHVLNYRG